MKDNVPMSNIIKVPRRAAERLSRGVGIYNNKSLSQHVPRRPSNNFNIPLHENHYWDS